ncbi:MAG: Gfo/Idh/MocA family protein [Bryobacteraceae bacterium]
MPDHRRAFLKSAIAAGAASYSRILGANDRIRLAGLGTGGRCTYLLGLAAREPGTDIAAVCDVYEPKLRIVKEKVAPAAQEYLDYRQVLERKDLDAVIIGSPDHWHVPMTMDAVRAGKDVYVEKPVSHNIEEGAQLEKIVAASRQIVQVGYQQRSWDHFKFAREVVRSGRLGKISLIIASWYQDYLSRMRVAEIETAKLDWKKFFGNAPDQPFDALRFTRWRWFWDFGGGHLTDLYSHYGDVIQWYMDSYSPTSVVSIGTRNAIPRFECPDTLTTAYEYPGFQITYHGSLVGSLDGGNILFRGSEGMMKLNRDGFAVYPEHVVPFEKTNYPEPEISMRSARDGAIDHMRNFLDCVRSRKAPNATVKDAVAIARAAHLGNQAFRKGALVEG